MIVATNRNILYKKGDIVLAKIFSNPKQRVAKTYRGTIEAKILSDTNNEEDEINIRILTIVDQHDGWFDGNEGEDIRINKEEIVKKLR